MEEIWKDIEGYEGYYQVSNLGMVMSLKQNRHSKLRQFKTKHGYMQIVFFHDGKFKTHKVHRLVASAFLENPENKRTVNHINGNKSDNRVENLEWNTYSENNKHAIDTKLRVIKKNKHSHMFGRSNRKKMVVNTKNGKIYNSAKCAYEDSGLNISIQHFRSMLNPKQKAINNTDFTYL